MEMQTIDFNQPADVILEQQAQFFLKGVPSLGIDKAREYARKTMPWLHCPHYGGRVEPMACMPCSFGHMTECHYPLECAEANCSHYKAETQFEDIDLEDEP